MESIVYCEFLSGSWQQPFNTISNLAFLIAGLALTVFCWRNPTRYHVGWVVTVILLTVGVTSAIWHHSSTPLMIMLNIIFIGLLVITLGWLIFYELTKRFYLSGALATVIAIGALGIFYSPFTALNGSLFYLFLFIILLVVMYKLTKQYTACVPTTQLALCFLGLGIFARSVDMTNCESLIIGTHFLWHVCVALGMYYLSVAVLAAYHDNEKCAPV